MENQITIREAVTETDAAAFWEQLYAYFKRDIFPDPGDPDRAYFLGDDYRAHMQKLRARAQDRAYFLFFCRDGRDIGFAMPVIYTTEDGKCFILEFCVCPEYRGNGTGRRCAKALLDWAAENGARYAELNYGGDERRCRFWADVGFVRNGVDEWGQPLMLLPPEEEMPILVERLADPEDWQLKKLENGYLAEIGEPVQTEDDQERLVRAIQDGRIVFFVARRGCRAVGMYSVSRHFSTFCCADTGVCEDVYVEPAFRKKGIARKLTEAAQSWCRENGLASLTVCCAPCDEERYRALGFTERLGTTRAYLP